ncbi:myozenin-2b [Erpetoichthys calabaricus]|uniref:Myozenin 2b n=1 Tax=Erpetoichthys calabaricus TaxID=27687 RepID=A0A8C4S967_ERPCA|nr:myozenin-2b [Erpetoichthys calabaricus]
MMSHTAMMTKERKMQAAAIVREIHGNGNESDTMDLGKKISVPRDIMFEELSLLSNRGSRLFKMRQRRSEKYTFENLQNEANIQMSNCVPLQTQKSDVSEHSKGELSGVDGGQAPKTPPNTPDPRTPPNPETIAPGYGGPLKDVPSEKFNTTAIPKSYHSPWEQEIINDPDLQGTLNPKMPIPEPKPEGPDYKNFNRVATPFGGFDKASKLITFKLPELDLNPANSIPNIPEFRNPVAKRPTFNRTAQGWNIDGSPVLIPSVSVSLPVPESEDL